VLTPVSLHPDRLSPGSPRPDSRQECSESWKAARLTRPMVAAFAGLGGLPLFLLGARTSGEASSFGGMPAGATGRQPRVWLGLPSWGRSHHFVR
jgi:hypothetical protein